MHFLYEYSLVWKVCVNKVYENYSNLLKIIQIKFPKKIACDLG